jgi:hypothetical protein
LDAYSPALALKLEAGAEEFVLGKGEMSKWNEYIVVPCW